MSLSDPLPGTGRHRPVSPRRPVEQARVGAVERIEAARDAMAALQMRHDRAADRVEALSRRRAALELELADAERERDQTSARLDASRQALDAAERRLIALNERD
jgi:septal ring factor EnvC (AmiA/AmiB activator)